MVELDLTGQGFRLIGAGGAVCDALRQALASAGARDLSGHASEAAQIAVILAPLLPDESFRAAAILDEVQHLNLPKGRMVLVISAAGLVPLRRFPRYSAEMASLVSAIRAEAMRRAPQVLVNAVAAGQIGADAAYAGDAAMQTHTALAQPAEISALTDTVLFFCDPLNSYCTGQTLAVDNGWSTGYARNF